MIEDTFTLSKFHFAHNILLPLHSILLYYKEYFTILTTGQDCTSLEIERRPHTLSRALLSFTNHSQTLISSYQNNTTKEHCIQSIDINNTVDKEYNQSYHQNNQFHYQNNTILPILMTNDARSAQRTATYFLEKRPIISCLF